MSLDRLFDPAGVAVVGASARPGALNTRFVEALLRHRYTGFIAPVNGRYAVVAGLSAFPDVVTARKSGPIDLVVIGLNRDGVESAIDDAAAAGAAGVLVFSSGFGETGADGAFAEQALAERCSAVGMRLIGPNSPGFLNVSGGACPTALGVGFREPLLAGGVAVIAQSGGVGGLITELLMDAETGVRITVCTGNEADVDSGEVLTWLAQDPQTCLVTLYLEGFRNGASLRRGLDALANAGKPVLVLKVGGEGAAARATAAHTGALATDDVAVDVLLDRVGSIRVRSVEAMVDAAVVLSKHSRRTRPHVGVVTTSGGAGVLAVEGLERAGVSLGELLPEQAERLRAIAPSFAGIGNPADMSGMFSEQPQLFEDFIREFSAGALDIVVLVLTVHPPDRANALADQLIDLARNAVARPIVMWFGGASVDAARVKLRPAGFVVFDDPRRCGEAIAVVGRPASALPDATVERTCDEPVPGRPASEAVVLAALDRAGVRIPPFAVMDDVPPSIGFDGPYVVKAIADGLLHKSDIGAVVVGVQAIDLEAAALEVVGSARVAGFRDAVPMVQQMVPIDHELIVGVRTVREVGLILVVSEGGTDVELSPRPVHALLPLRPGEAEQLLRRLPMAGRWEGHRGKAPLDLTATADAVERIAALAQCWADDLSALEVNPLIVHPDGHGVHAVDGVLELVKDRTH